MAVPLAEIKDVTAILKQWDEQSPAPGYDPVPILARLSELIEEQTEIYYNKNPDPFDERHPSRTDPGCELGPVLKILFRKENFMTKLVNDYLRDNYYSRQNIQKDSCPMNIAACRLMLVIMPGLETSAVFQPDMENLILRLFSWAEKSMEPLQSYATGLLAAAMEVQDIATTYREQNGKLVPLMIQRLHNMDPIEEESDSSEEETFKRPFAIFGQENKDATEVQDVRVSFESSDRNVEKETNERKKGHEKDELSASPSSGPSLFKRRKPNSSDNILLQEEDVKMTSSILFSPAKSYIQGPSTFRSVSQDSYSNSDSSYKRGPILFHPCTKETKQMCILRYLTPMGEYQDFLGHVFEKHALDLILEYINVRETRDPRIAFEALKYLAALLCHKKFSLEFLQMGGLLRLLKVPRPSVAATGVSICLYYLAYCEDAMERICIMTPNVRSDLVGYALSLLKCSHDSGRCHATMFFGLSFQFKVILLEFDKQGGLRMLYNIISVLPILRTNDEALDINEDEECAARQIVRHVCVALKKYLEAHLYHKYLQVTRQNNPSSAPSPQPPYKAIILSECDKKACTSTPDEIYVQVRRLQELLPFKASWSPVDELMQLDGVTTLLQIIAFAYEWNYSGRIPFRGETVRSALDALTVCCVSSRVQERLCERVILPEAALTVGINIILGAAEGEIVADADVQKSALAVLVNCVSAPIHRVGGGVLRYSLAGNNSSRKKQPIKSSEDLIQRMWESVRSNNGIMVLLQLMTIKTPITDADCIRGMACKALAGLARSDHVKQIVSKLPMFVTGQLQNLMRDPILQEKRQEHVSFQQYAYELLERISGKTGSREFDTSLANIHKANVVAQTRIQFNDKQLLQLIYQHLSTRGMVESAAALATEANLSVPNLNRTGGPVSSLYRSPAVTTTPTRPRTLSARVGNSIQPSPSNSLVNKHSATPESSRVNGEQFKCPTISEIGTTPIKIRKSINVQNPLSQQIPYQRSLEKQISYNETGHLSGDLQSAKTKLDRHISLDTIVTEYLYNQHALCKNPMVTCPAFDLFTPHKCPDPRSNRTSSQSMNFAARSSRRPLGYNAHKLDRKLVHSQFCPVKNIRPPENDLFFTCCAFRPSDQNLITASYNGEVKIYNTFTGLEIVSVQCHDTYIYYVEVRKDSSMLITSSTWRRPLSCVWSLQSNSITLKFPLDDQEIAQFSNLQDKLIGTKGEIATIYDIASARPIQTLVPAIGNGYIKNKATFSPNDDLVLSDGVLWDVNSGKQIHKFDKLNQNISGVFHPNGIEVVSNTEVWDMRTFNLLRTVPALDESNIKFSSTNTIYTVSLEQDSDSTDKQFDSSFKTIDATDYSSIATIDVRRSIYDLAVNSWDTQIAVVENLGSFDSVQESVVRLYDVGRKRDQEDEIEDDDIDSEDIDGSDRSDDNSISEGDNDVANMLLDEVLENVNERRPRNRNNRRNRRNRPNRDAEMEEEDSDDSVPTSDDSTFNMSDDNISIDDLLEY